MKKMLLLILSSLFLFGCSDIDVEKETSEIQNKNIEKRIIALGDSLTAGYNLDLKEAYPSQLEELLKTNGYNYKITNAGVSGDTSTNLLSRIKLYDETKTDIYLLNIGSNDGLRKQEVETMKENIIKIIGHIRSVNHESEIVLFGMQLPLNLGLNYSREFKNTFEDIADEKDTYFYEFFLEGVAKDVKLNLRDGMHPNKEGYKIISTNIYDFLTENNLLKK